MTVRGNGLATERQRVVTEENIVALQAFLNNLGLIRPPQLAIGFVVSLWPPHGLGIQEGTAARLRDPVFRNQEEVDKFFELF